MSSKQTRQIHLGPIAIGGGAPVSIQSMTNTDTRDCAATLKQIADLHQAGCDIIRVAVPDRAAVDALPEIISQSPMPVIADIHFDYKLALGALEAGVDGLRINPGNIGTADKVAQIAKLANERSVPIRVGANSGSLPKQVLDQVLSEKNHSQSMAQALVDCALEQCRILEDNNFTNIKVSLKASDVVTTVKAYRLFAEQYDYPLHIGVTEAGTVRRGTVKSAIGIGALLLDGIGDTLRVSLTADPVEEIKVALMILEGIGLRSARPEIVSCPTCGRTEIDLMGMTDEVEAYVQTLKQQGKVFDINKIAVMGCVVNGPGEAKDADLGITGGKDKIIVFRKGEVVGSFSVEEGMSVFKQELDKSCH